VSDTGVGLPADFEAKHSNSLGLQLVSSLARQIDGRLEIGPGPGAVFEVIFTPKHPKPIPSSPTP
jgi:two-component sensor histidine kinase